MSKEYRRAYTYSGDYYSATKELWKQYWIAVEQDNGDFFYGPSHMKGEPNHELL